MEARRSFSFQLAEERGPNSPNCAMPTARKRPEGQQISEEQNPPGEQKLAAADRFHRHSR